MARTANGSGDDEASRLSYRFALQPRWLALHVFAVVALAAMIGACFWQISRLHEKQDRNALYDARSAQPVQDVTEVAGLDASDAQIDQARYRVVQATGRYLSDEEVFVRSRSLDGLPGAWVVTPLALQDDPGTVVVVNRGWIPASNTTPTLPEGAEAPAGTVTVTGLAMASEQRGVLGATDAAGVELPVLARLDIDRLQQQLDARALPLYVQLQSQEPTQAGQFPAAVPPPPRDEGPHRGYAGQWAIFAVIWAFGYPMLVRRSAKRRLDEQRDTDVGPAASTQLSGRSQRSPSPKTGAESGPPRRRIDVEST